MKVPTRWSSIGALAAVVSFAAGCGGGSDAQSSAGGESSTSGQPGGAAGTVPTVTVPASPCDWVTVADVEAVLGPLAEPPSVANGCRYVMQVPEDVAASRRKVIEFQEKLAEMGATLGNQAGGPMAQFRKDPATYAVVVSIDPRGSVAAEIGTAAARNRLSEWAGNSGQSRSASAGAAVPVDDGWDGRLLVPYGFGGRAGHLTIIAEALAPDVPDEPAKALAALYRDRIADLPFPSRQPQQAGGPDPCGLLSREAAEAVLGTLVVPPYRATGGSPLADPGGASCAYFTKGHRVLVVTPTRSGGREEYKAGRVVGALVGAAAGQQAAKIEGPWDHAQIATLTGALTVLKDDKLLQFDFLTSSTDATGAVELAKQAVANL